MPTTLTDLLREQAGSLAADLARELRRSEAPHYRSVSEQALHLRCQRLVEAFLESSDGNPAPFQRYIRELTEQRISEGYYLPEMQQALVLLEHAAWNIAAEGSNIATLVRHLSIITSTIGQAKDELARAFLAGRRRAEGALARLKLEGLFDGTDAHVEPVDPSVAG